MRSGFGAIIIGESYWYKYTKAEPGDTFGISISNVMTHARFALWLNNAVKDSTFENIRVFGNGFTSVFFGEGTMENLLFRGIRYDEDVKPVNADEQIVIEWNNTESRGLNAVYFNGTSVRNVEFCDMRVPASLDSVFGGHGNGDVKYYNIASSANKSFNNTSGIDISER